MTYIPETMLTEYMCQDKEKEDEPISNRLPKEKKK